MATAPKTCPDCKAANYVYLGDTTDNAVGVRCWQCKRRLMIETPCHGISVYDINNALVVEGEPNPR